MEGEYYEGGGGSGWRLVAGLALVAGIVLTIAVLIVPGVTAISADATARSQAQAQIAQARADAQAATERERTERAIVDAQAGIRAQELRTEIVMQQGPTLAVLAIVVCGGLVCVAILATLGWRDRQRAALLAAAQRQAELAAIGGGLVWPALPEARHGLDARQIGTPGRIRQEVSR